MYDDNIAIYIDYAERSHRDGAFSLSLRDLTFSKFEVTYIAGENGSGKSTLMRMLALEDEPDVGKIWIAGRQITDLSGREKADLMGGAITYIPQAGMGLNKRNPVQNITRILQDFDNIGKRQAERRALAALEQVGLDGHLCSRSVKKLSGGQKARVAVAKAIAVERPIILADEIFKEIDSTNVLTIMRLFQDLAKQGYAIIVIGHLPRDQEQYFHHIIRMSGGRVVGDTTQTPAPVPTAAPHATSSPDRPLRHRRNEWSRRLMAGLTLVAMQLFLLLVWPQPLSLFAGGHTSPTPHAGGAAPPITHSPPPTLAPTPDMQTQPTQAMTSGPGATAPPETVPFSSQTGPTATAMTTPPAAAVNQFDSTVPPSQPELPTASGQEPPSGDSPLIVPGGPPPTVVSEPDEISRDPSAWSGGYYRDDSDWCGRSWVAVYGGQTMASQATLDISLDATPGGDAQLTLTGMGDELPAPAQIQITVNGQPIFSGVSPFPNWDGVGDCANPTWTDVTLTIPAGILHAGDNQFAIANLESNGAVGQPPYVMLSTTVLRPSS